MIYTAKELYKKGETEYSLRNLVSNGSLFLIEHGIYSDEESPLIDESYICKKYPNATLTGLSAFYVHDLTDHIPDQFYLSTEQHSFPIRREGVIQSYQDKSIYRIGRCNIEFGSGKIFVYDLERTLIELIRNKDRYPSELYYEVLSSFRSKKSQLDFYKINTYLSHFKNKDVIAQKIKEVL